MSTFTIIICIVVFIGTRSSKPVKKTEYRKTREERDYERMQQDEADANFEKWSDQDAYNNRHDM